MKHLYSLFILFPLFSFAQWQVSAGAAREFEHLFSGESGELIGNTYWKNAATLSVGYEYDRMLFSARFSYLDNDLSREAKVPFGYISKYYSITDYYSADLSYSYVGFGLNAQRVIEQKNFSFLIGGGVKFDINTSDNESNHLHRRVKTWSSTGNVFLDVSNNDAFDMYIVAPYTISTGIALSLRYKVKNLLIEVPFNIGVQPFNRIQLREDYLYHSAQNSLFPYFNFGIRLGYIFNKKVKE